MELKKLKETRFKVNNKDEFDNITNSLINFGCKWFSKEILKYNGNRFLYVNTSLNIFYYDDKKQYYNIGFRELNFNDLKPKVLKVINGVEYC